MTSTAHTDRAHATLAPSAAHRWMICPGSIVLEQGFPNTTSVYAAEGTAAHELASWCLANDEQPEDHLGLWIDTRSTNGNPFIDLSLDEDDLEREENRYFEITDDMVAAVTVYTDHVAALCKQSDDYELAVEQRLDGTYLHPEIFGTGDMTGYSEKLRHLDVVDYKHGKGKNVAVEDNPQLFLYGALTAARFHNRPLETITLHIVQPRAGGKSIKSRKYDLFDIFEFEDEVKTAATAVDDAKAEIGSPNETAWAELYLTAGDHCGFCKALASCPAARANALTKAQAEFDDMTGEMTLPDFMKFTPAQLAETLGNADQLLAWIKAVQVFAHEQACAGNTPTDYKLVAKRANRKWRDDVDARRLLTTKARLDYDSLFEAPKFKSPAKIETMMKKKAFEAWLKDCTDDEGNGPIVKISSGTNLVPASDPRPAVKMDGTSEFGEAE